MKVVQAAVQAVKTIFSAIAAVGGGAAVLIAIAAIVPLAGAIFKLTGSDGKTYDGTSGENGEIVTDENG